MAKTTPLKESKRALKQAQVWLDRGDKDIAIECLIDAVRELVSIFEAQEGKTVSVLLSGGKAGQVYTVDATETGGLVDLDGGE